MKMSGVSLVIILLSSVDKLARSSLFSPLLVYPSTSQEAEDRTNFPDTGEGAQDLQANSVQRQPEKAITLHMAGRRNVEKNAKTDSCQNGPVC